MVRVLLRFEPSRRSLLGAWNRLTLLQKRGKQAAAAFQSILSHRSVVLNFSIGALAQFDLARAQSPAGESSAARTSCQNFFALWQHAYPGIPILKQAKSEYAKLQ
jgi:hypothetical protein